VGERAPDRSLTPAQQVMADGADVLLHHRQPGVSPELVGDLLDDPGNTVLDRQHGSLGVTRLHRGEGGREGGVTPGGAARKELLSGLVGVGPRFALIGDGPLPLGVPAGFLVGAGPGQGRSASPTASTAPRDAVPTR